MFNKKNNSRKVIFLALVASLLTALTSHALADASDVPLKLSAQDQKKWDEYVALSGLKPATLYYRVLLYTSPNQKDIVSSRKHFEFLMDLFEGNLNNPQSPAPEIKTRTPIKSVDSQHWDQSKIDARKALLRPIAGPARSLTVDQQILEVLNSYIQASDSDRIRMLAEYKLSHMILNGIWPRDRYPYISYKLGELKPVNDNDIEVSYEGGGPSGDLIFGGTVFNVKQGEKIVIKKGTVSALFYNPANPYTGKVDEEELKNPKKQLLPLMFNSRVPFEDSRSLLVDMNISAAVKKIIFKPDGKSVVE